MGSVQKYFLGFFLKYCMYFSFRPSCDLVYGSLANARKTDGCRPRKNLTLTRWFKFSFCSSSFYIPLRSKRNIIDVFVMFKYPAL